MTATHSNSAGRTVFVTGASSGIGLETARYFFDRGWNTVATMRDPEKRCTGLDRGLFHQTRV